MVFDTDIDGSWQTITVCDSLFMTETGCPWQIQTVHDRHKLLYDRHKPSMTETCFPWQIQTVFDHVHDRHRLSVTDRLCLSETQTVCDKHRLSVTNTDCLWQTQTVCDKHRLSVTCTSCPWCIIKSRCYMVMKELFLIKLNIWQLITNLIRSKMELLFLWWP